MSRWDTCKKFVSHFSSSVCTVYVWLLETWKIDNLSTILLIWTILLHFFLSFCRQNSLDIHSRLWFSNCRVCTKVLKVLNLAFWNLSTGNPLETDIFEKRYLKSVWIIERQYIWNWAWQYGLPMAQGHKKHSWDRWGNWHCQIGLVLRRHESWSYSQVFKAWLSFVTSWVWMDTKWLQNTHPGCHPYKHSRWCSKNP